MFRHRRRLVTAVLIVAAAAALAACQQKNAGLDSFDSMNTASTKPMSLTATAQLGKAWEADQNNIGKGLAYANGLESIGQTEQQLKVLKQLNQGNPGNAKLASLYGKKLVAAGKPSDALPILESASAAPGADWRVHSALGSAYDQQGLYDKARAAYGKALALRPNELPVLNNMGMSHALQGDLKAAETVLRQAYQLPKSGAQPRIRQNLALVIGLQGRFDEARKIASEDLPRDQVEANMDYLQKMLSQPNTWQQISSEQG
jgi:Flp pilus assembly protein TadD